MRHSKGSVWVIARARVVVVEVLFVLLLLLSLSLHRISALCAPRRPSPLPSPVHGGRVRRDRGRC